MIYKITKKSNDAKKNLPETPSFYNADDQHEFMPETILAGKIKWASIKGKSYHKRAAVMIVVRSMWDGNQGQLANLLDVNPNSLEQFFSTLRRKFKKNELDIEDLKPHISRDYHHLLEKFFMV